MAYQGNDASTVNVLHNRLFPPWLWWNLRTGDCGLREHRPAAWLANRVRGERGQEQASLPAAARQVLDIGCSTIDDLDQQLDAIDSKLMPLARRLPGCQVLCRQWGIGLVLFDSGPLVAALQASS